MLGIYFSIPNFPNFPFRLKFAKLGEKFGDVESCREIYTTAIESISPKPDATLVRAFADFEERVKEKHERLPISSLEASYIDMNL